MKDCILGKDSDLTMACVGRFLYFPSCLRSDIEDVVEVDDQLSSHARAWRFSGHFIQRPTSLNRDRRCLNGLTSRPELDPTLNRVWCWRLKRLIHRGYGSQAEARWARDGASHRLVLTAR